MYFQKSINFYYNFFDLPIQMHKTFRYAGLYFENENLWNLKKITPF